MARSVLPAATRVTLTIDMPDGRTLPVILGEDMLGFVGRYARLPAFGPRGAMLKLRLLPAA